MTATSGGAAKSSGRQPRIGGLLGRLKGTYRHDDEWLVKAFPHASAPLLIEAASRVQRRRYRRGDVIVAEGEAADRFYVVTSGEAEIFRSSNGARTATSTSAPTRLVSTSAK